MKALSVKPPWATAILMWQKVVECRTWKTDYRGDLLICSSSAPWWAGTISKHALCVVRLAGIEPFEEKHLAPAFINEMPKEESYAWLLDSLLFIEPFEVKGKLHIYDVDDALIKPKDQGESFVAFAERHYKPLMKWEDKYATRGDIEADWDAWMAYLKKLDKQAGL